MSADLSPTLCRSAAELPEGEGWTYEPKYDGIRVLAFSDGGRTTLGTRNGRDKAQQFPEVAAEVGRVAREVGASLVLDGEIVALEDGEPTGFEALQSRMHLRSRRDVERHAALAPAALVVFDLLAVDSEARVGDRWAERRRDLESLLEGKEGPGLRLGETTGDRERILREARAGGWEGVVAKRTGSTYAAGRRSADWRKVKLEHRQEFVVGGYTEPRGSRRHLGALLLGYYDEGGRLVYAGHTGTGFTREGLGRMHRRLARLARRTPPFHRRPRTNQPAHWVTPSVVVEVRFTEWTRDGKLRHPVFLGVRDDRDPRSVVRERRSAGSPARRDGEVVRGGEGSMGPFAQAPAAGVAERIERLEERGGGTLGLPDGSTLELTSLQKVFFPAADLTKGDLLRYYARMSPLVLPWMEGRPLVLRRYPEGVAGDSFYQQAAPDEVPEGVRVEAVGGGRGGKQRRLVGGGLATLLYSVQLGSITYHPWHSRVGDLDSADYTILDLDPGPRTEFARVVEVARWVKEELDGWGLHGALKTSGASGLHVYLPLPSATPVGAATLVAQIIATRVAQRHPRHATVERMRRRRPRGAVYVDYLQNLLGKTVSGVYAVRATPEATVSTPLGWEELTDDLDPRAFTLETVPRRVAERGDLWARAMGVPNSLDRLLPARP